MFKVRPEYHFVFEDEIFGKVQFWTVRDQVEAPQPIVLDPILSKSTLVCRSIIKNKNSHLPLPERNLFLNLGQVLGEPARIDGALHNVCDDNLFKSTSNNHGIPLSSFIGWQIVCCQTLWNPAS